MCEEAEACEEASLQFRSRLFEERVNWYGRAFADGNRADFSAPAAGFEVRFSGTEICAEIASRLSEAPSEAAGRAYLTVYTDGRKTGGLALGADGPAWYVLAEGLSSGVHTVKVLKNTERKYGAAMLHSLRTDGIFLPPPEKPRLCFELLGDSIMSGSECMRAAEADSFLTESENCLLGYGYRAAEAFGAQVNAVTRSGALVSDYMGLPALPQEYEFSFRGGPPWDFSRFRPDVILLDLGTNDVRNEVPKTLLFESYLAFVRLLRKKNPQSTIVCCEGAITDCLRPLVQGVAETLAAEGDGKVCCFSLPCMHASEGHPTVREHEQNGRALAAYLARLPGLSPQTR